jgi:predicted SprT family Zn-dependent metalloprotease
MNRHPRSKFILSSPDHSSIEDDDEYDDDDNDDYDEQNQTSFSSSSSSSQPSIIVLDQSSIIIPPPPNNNKSTTKKKELKSNNNNNNNHILENTNDYVYDSFVVPDEEEISYESGNGSFDYQIQNLSQKLSIIEVSSSSSSSLEIIDDKSINNNNNNSSFMTANDNETNDNDIINLIDDESDLDSCAHSRLVLTDETEDEHSDVDDNPSETDENYIEPAVISTNVSLPTTTKNKNKLKNNSLQLLIPSIHQEFNEKIFNSKLNLNSIVNITWNKRLLKTGGRCRYVPNNIPPVTIELSSKIVDNEERLKSILLHEMVHAAVFMIDQVRTGNAHGARFMKWGKRAEERVHIPVTRYHHFTAFKPFIYQCIRCKYQLSRYSKSFDTEKGKCPGCLQIGSIIYIQKLVKE